MKSGLHICFLLFGLLFTSSLMFAQSEKKYIKEADELYKLGEKNKALESYLKAHEITPDNADVNYKIGVLYLETVYKHRSLSFLEKAYSINPNINSSIHWFLGISYHFNMMWDKAIEQYELAKKTLKHEDPNYSSIDKRIYECNNGKEFMAKPVEATIVNIGSGINTKYPEFAPVISADESVLIFTSRREGSTGGELDDNGEFHEDIYISEKHSNGEWGAPKNIGTNINTEGHDASIGLSADARELFVYDGNSGSGMGDIKYCKLKKDSSWSKPYPLEINTKYSEASICISPDGSTVFFTSNRPSGYGALDIYISVLEQDGDWSSPKNLGSVINTEFNEDGVFLDFDGKTLHFSSQGHKGMGGYDIFKSVYDSTTNTWSQPENIGYPINTADDDIYFVLSGDGKHGYYASVKEDGMGEKDIYMVNMPPRKDYEQLVQKMEVLLKKEKMEVLLKKEIVTENPIEQQPVTIAKQPDQEPLPEPEPVIIEKQPVILKGKVYDLKTKKTIAATVQLIDNKGGIMKEVKTLEDGQYIFDVTSENERKYSVTAQKAKYGIVTKDVTVPASKTEKIELINDLNLGELMVGAKFILRNIYYDFDKASLKAESFNELDKLLKLLKDNPTMKVRIGSHTDNKGSNAYNISLSNRRALSVVNWLVKNGVSKSRLTNKGYGETSPIATNDDEEEGRELNRRTEFEVIK